MSLSFVNDTFATSPSGTTLTGSEPASTANGDLLRADVVVYDQNGGTITAPTGPTWTLVRRDDYTITRQGGGSRQWTHAIYKRIRNGSESFAWTIPNQYSEIYVATYRTTLASIDIDANAAAQSSNSGNTTTVTGTGVTSPAANSFLHWAEVGYSDGLTAGPGGMSAREVNADTVLNFYDESVAAGGTGNRTATITTDATDQTWSVVMTMIFETAAASIVPEEPRTLPPRRRVFVSQAFEFPVAALPIGRLIEEPSRRPLSRRIVQTPIEKPLAALVVAAPPVVIDAPTAAPRPRRVPTQPVAEVPLAALVKPTMVPEPQRIEPRRTRVRLPAPDETPTISLAPTSGGVDDGGGGFAFVRSPALVILDEPVLLPLAPTLGAMPLEAPPVRIARARAQRAPDEVPLAALVKPPAVLEDQRPPVTRRAVRSTQPDDVTLALPIGALPQPEFGLLPRRPAARRPAEETPLAALPIGAIPQVEPAILPRRSPARRPLDEPPLAAAAAPSLLQWFDPGPDLVERRSRIVQLPIETPLAALPIGAFPVLEPLVLPRARAIRQPVAEVPLAALAATLLPWLDEATTAPRARSRVVIPPAVPEPLSALVIPLGALPEELALQVRRQARIRMLEPDFVPPGLIRPWFDDAPPPVLARRRAVRRPPEPEPLKQFVPVTLLPFFDWQEPPRLVRRRVVLIVNEQGIVVGIAVYVPAPPGQRAKLYGRPQRAMLMRGGKRGSLK